MGDLDVLREVIQSYPALAIIVLGIWVYRIRKYFIHSVKSLKKSHDKDIESLKDHFEKEVDKMIVLTDKGMDDGLNSRKELWIEIRKQSDRTSKIEGRLNGGSK